MLGIRVSKLYCFGFRTLSPEGFSNDLSEGVGKVLSFGQDELMGSQGVVFTASWLAGFFMPRVEGLRISVVAGGLLRLPGFFKPLGF
jgi:hypothetical protein